jgi:hypothetical protein
MFGLTALRSDTEHPEQPAPASHTAGYSVTTPLDSHDMLSLLSTYPQKITISTLFRVYTGKGQNTYRFN